MIGRSNESMWTLGRNWEKAVLEQSTREPSKIPDRCGNLTLESFLTDISYFRKDLSHNVLWSLCIMMRSWKTVLSSFERRPQWRDVGRVIAFLIFFFENVSDDKQWWHWATFTILAIFSAQNMWWSWLEWWPSLNLPLFWWNSWKMVIFRISWGNAGKASDFVYWGSLKYNLSFFKDQEMRAIWKLPHTTRSSRWLQKLQMGWPT